MGYFKTKLIWAGMVLGCVAVAAMAPRAGGQQITPVNGGLVQSPRVTINNGPNDQTEPHIDKDLVVYTDFSSGSGRVRYFRFSTGVDIAIPTPPGDVDTLSSVSGNFIAFSRQSADRRAIMLFNVLTSSLVEVDPHAWSARFSTAIGGNTVAFLDTTVGNGNILVTDVTTPLMLPVSLTASPGVEGNPNVAPDGNTVVWESCDASFTNCDVSKAVRVSGLWTTSLVASTLGNELNPDTDGTWIVYDSDRPSATGPDIYFQPVAGGSERQLTIADIQRNPSISQGVIGFETKATPIEPADLFVYVMATNTLYQITSTPLVDESLNDVSVLPNGDISLVWAANDGPGGESNIYATTFTPAGLGDFSFDGIAPLTMAASGSASTTVTVNPLNGFSSAVNLSISGEPAGVTATLSPNSVTPSGGNSASSVFNVSAASFVVPTNFTLTVTGASGVLSHSATANVSVTANPTSVSNSIGDMLNAGCIDNAGIGNALTSKLSAAQTAGNVQTAINTLTALKNQIQAQAGKHIHTACTIGGVAFNPVNVLLLDVQALIDSLRVSLIPDPITGYVTDAGSVGLAGATVSVFNSGGAVVAMATTDITGFYFLATTGVLAPGANYTIAVTGIPAGFGNVTPPNQAFTWQGSAIALGNFAVN